MELLAFELLQLKIHYVHSFLVPPKSSALYEVQPQLWISHFFCQSFSMRPVFQNYHLQNNHHTTPPHKLQDPKIDFCRM